MLIKSDRLVIVFATVGFTFCHVFLRAGAFLCIFFPCSILLHWSVSSRSNKQTAGKNVDSHCIPQKMSVFVDVFFIFQYRFTIDGTAF